MLKYIARQPIFNVERVVYGYELLFRSSLANFFDGSNPEGAAASTADNMFLFGVERLTQGHRAFLNCTRDFIVRDYPTLLPKERVVIEVLESIKIDDKIIDACRRLKHAGYLLALDDFVETPEAEPLIALADFIKVDILATSHEEQVRLARKHAKTSIRLVAEKVETYEDFKRAAGWGYSYFQGYFFSRPEILTRHDIPSYKLNYLRVLQAVNRSPMDMNYVSNRIKEEASLSYRLLRYLNSPAFFLAAEVSSIPHALSLLGERGVRKWVSLAAVACMGEDKPQELVLLPLMRARFCELLAPLAGLAKSANDLFLLGLLSAIDAILDMKMEDVLKEVALRDEIRDALLGKKNSFRQVYEIALNYEMGMWDDLEREANLRGINVDDIPVMFMQAVEWSRGILCGNEFKEIETQ